MPAIYLHLKAPAPTTRRVCHSGLGDGLGRHIVLCDAQAVELEGESQASECDNVHCKYLVPPIPPSEALSLCTIVAESKTRCKAENVT